MYGGLMRGLIARMRFCAVIASMALLVVGTYIFQIVYKPFLLNQFRVLWAKCLIWSAGAKLNIRGHKITKAELKNAMVVSNHISWLDTVVMLRLYFVRYVGKVEMLKWPILSTLIKAGGTIFINRQNKKDILKVNQQVAELLQHGATVGLYPEGKTTEGYEVGPFKAPILEAAIIAKSTIVPVVFSYRKEDNKLAVEASFANVGWLETVMNTLRLKDLQINVTVLPPIKASDFTTRDELNNYLHKQISDCYMSQQ